MRDHVVLLASSYGPATYLAERSPGSCMKTAPSMTDIHVVDTGSPPSRRALLWPIVKIVLSVLAHAGFVSCLAVVIWSRQTVQATSAAAATAADAAAAGADNKDTDNYSGNARQLYRYYLIASSLAGVFYILMMVEAADCATYRHLRSFRANLLMREYVDKMRAQMPKMTWFAHNYHYELRAQTKYRRNAKGEVNVRHVARHREKIVTNRKTEVVTFRRCRDVTGESSGAGSPRRPVVRMECQKAFTFKDERSRAVYQKRFAAFRQRTHGKDEFTDHGVDMDIEGFQETLMASEETGGAPCWMSELWFWLFTMLLLTWPHRWLFCALTPKVRITFTKELEF